MDRHAGFDLAGRMVRGSIGAGGTSGGAAAAEACPEIGPFKGSPHGTAGMQLAVRIMSVVTCPGSCGAMKPFRINSLDLYLEDRWTGRLACREIEV